MDSQAGTNYYLDDHLGTTQMELSAGGYPLWKGEFAPFGQELDTQPTAMHYKFTGKERDAESGLDYFGARYYGSNMGRFMSPDWAAKAEPVPYAKLSNPQTLNLYAYVGNNPLSRTDPTGHYTCHGSKDQCAQLQTGLNLVKGAINKLGADSDRGKALQKVLSFYGGATDKNGVNVSFASLAKGTLADESSSDHGKNVSIRLDLKQIGSLNNPSAGIFSITERAAQIEHEGTHGVQDRARGSGPQSEAQERTGERGAYGTESYFFQGLNVNSAQGLWSWSWSSVDAERNRQDAVNRDAENSVKTWCAEPGAPCK